MPGSESLWQERALDTFPELAEKVIEAENFYALWIDLHFALERAYKDPPDQSLIARIYAYARWCLAQPRGETAEDDLSTAVMVCFIEDLPKNPATRRDMPHWFTRDEILEWEPLFRYGMSQHDFRDLLSLFRS